jgi:hypothetical protein
MATREERPRSASARGRLWLWVGRVLLALVGLIVLLLLLGLLYQFLATRIAYRNYPAPGEMVLVSGHDMQFYCTGKARRGPTVVMDAGLGAACSTGRRCSRRWPPSRGCAPTTAPASAGATRGKCRARASGSSGSFTPCSLMP